MKNLVFWLGTAIVAASFGLLVQQKETVLAEGRRVLLELVPVDPRSYMQGDYMRLRYAIERAVDAERLARSGCVVVTLDEDDVATLVRLDAGEPLAPGEQRLRYRRRGELRIGAESFLFEEGQAETYEAARYGELCVDTEGNSILIGLCGSDHARLGRGLVR